MPLSRLLVPTMLVMVLFCPLSSYAQVPVNIQPGDTGQGVSILQRVLNTIGSYVTPIGQETTYFGPKTAAALQALQCEHGIVCSGTPQTTGFGLVGPKTKALLESLFPLAALRNAAGQLAALAGAGSGLIAHYPLDEGSGTSPIDVAGGTQGSLVGGASYVTGKIGSKAISFNGSDGYLLMPASPPLPEFSASNVTASVWVKRGSTSGAVGVLRERGNVNRGWELNITSSGAVEMVGYGVSGSAARTAAGVVVDTAWHHLVLVRDGSTYLIYVDGQTIALETQPSTFPSSGSGGLYAGAAAPTTGNPTVFYSVSIDDIRLYNRSLSAAEVRELYQSVGTTPTPTTPTPPKTTQYTLTVSTTGTGTVSGTGITCGTDCSEVFGTGTSITLTATPKSGSTFTGWSGTCSGTAPCTVTMNAAKNVSATFTTAPITTVPVAQAAMTLTHNSGGTNFTWELNCGGKACVSGTFVNGDYWVVPIDVDGRRTSTVTITNIAPYGVANGAESNPASETSQGIIMGYSHYSAQKNLMTKLPYQADPGESIIKNYAKVGDCGTKATEPGCSHSYDVLTVLAEVPPNNGATIFRPPFHGDWKPLYSTDNVRFERLPSMPAITGTRTATQFDAIVAAAKKRWSVPHYDTMHSNTTGEFMRATTPQDVLPDYAADQAVAYISDLTNMFGTESVAAKRPAVLALMQKGIDVYGIFKLGIPLGSGAGQHLGKKPALVFFAAMYDDPALVREVRGIASNPQYLERGFFQEDSQISVGVDGVVLWGERDMSPAVIDGYWAQLWGEWSARNLGTNTYDNKGTRGDPYGFIDGPGGGPDPTLSSGRNYQPCCSAGPIMGFAFTTLLMPWMDYVQNDWELVSYADRIWNGRGIPGFSGGYWSGHDECAPPDPRESLACAPHRSGKDCKYYGVTWGPKPGNPQQCIKVNEHSLTNGRWPQLHGFGSPVTNSNAILRIPTQTRLLWDTLRNCTDPKNASYPCRGLGSQPPSRTEAPDSSPIVIPPVIPAPVTQTPIGNAPSVSRSTTKSEPTKTSSRSSSRTSTKNNETSNTSTSQVQPTRTLTLARQVGPGTRGDDISSLQTFLKQKGYYTYPEITGFYGEVTRQAVQAFQRSQGLEDVGSVGPRTLAALLMLDGGATPPASGAVPSVSSGFTQNLTVGSRSEEVRALQVFLNTHGYIIAPSGEGALGYETSYFGERTRQALAAFQTAHSISPAVGYFGPQTRAVVQSLSQ